MTDKNKFHDEEYQFPNDEYVDDLQLEMPAIEEEETPIAAEELVEQPQAASGLRAIWDNHKRIIIITGAVAAIALVFGVMRMMHKPEAPAASAPSVVQAVTQPVTAAQPVIDPQMADQLTGLKQDSINNTVMVRQLQRQVQQLDSSLSQSRLSQQQLNQSLMVLVSQMQKLTDEVKTLSQPKVKVHAAPAVKPAEPVITFQLRAVVPGRAWIVASDGQSQSVAVGDHVPQYGTVQSINADEGIVITTSGKNIRF